jgi:site-specific DNA recombinase
VVWKLDRLYRLPKELENDLIPLAENGQVTIEAAMAGPIDLSTSAGRTMARVAVAFANQASEDTRERVKRQKQQARDEGKPNGGPRAFGWEDTTVPDPFESACLDQAVSDLMAGVSLAEVARRWNRDGVPQPQTGRANWNADIVRQVVSNPRNAGLVGHRVERRESSGRRFYSRPVVIGPAKWPAIIERERWERLQALLAQRSATLHIPRRRSLLTGLVSCSVCGATMVRTGARAGSGGGTRKAWRCPSVRGCGRISIDATGLEQLLVEATIQRADTPRLAAMLRQQQEPGEGDLVAELDRLNAILETQAEQLAEGRLTPDDYQRSAAAIGKRRSAVAARSARATSRSVLAPFAGRSGALRAAWPDLTLEQRRAVISAALGRVAVLPTLTVGRPTFDPRRVLIKKPA